MSIPAATKAPAAEIARHRVAPVLPYRYLVFYSIDDAGLIIRNVRHAARIRPY
jgi:hypothetical protein